MCITRVGRVLSIKGGKATVRLLDENLTSDVDVSMIDGVKRDTYVEIFADKALNVLTRKEAELRKRMWMEIRERAGRVVL